MNSKDPKDSSPIIMIVDDNLDNLKLLSDMLNKSGYKTRRAISGTLALKSVAATDFDLILLDINMPDISGYEVCQKLKQDPRLAKIPVIFISALNDVLDKVRAFEVGGVDYITKPFESREVLARIENQLRIIDLQKRLHNSNQKLIQNNQQLHNSNARYVKNSLVDPVTNFKTKISFIGQLRQNLKRYASNNNFFALLIIQCDRLKLYRNVLMSSGENQCLIYISQNIRKFVPKSTILGRLNETEFAVFIENINVENIDDIIQTISQIQQQLKFPFTIDSQEFFLNPSCGIVIGDNSYQASEQILCDARHALFYARSQGHGNYQIFDPEIQRRTLIDSELKLNFIKALSKKTLTIDYQPIISLKTEKISGYEANISCNSTTLQDITLEKLGYLAAETGFISELNRCLFELTCDRISQYQLDLSAKNSTVENLDPNFKIRVNLSSWQFLQSDLAAQVDKIIQDREIDRNKIMLVASEKAFVKNMELAIKNLKNLRQLAIQTSINDFSTNLFALINQHSLTIDDLKIDASLESTLDREFYATTIATAHKLGMTVTVDGIANMDRLNSFKELKCEFGQGAWLSCYEFQL